MGSNHSGVGKPTIRYELRPSPPAREVARSCVPYHPCGPVLSNLQRRYILGRIQSDLRSPSSISNLQRRHLRPDSVRSPISISNLQSPLSIRGPGGGGGLKPSRRCAMDSFTMQKDLHPLFAPFCNLQSAHTISRRLWREVNISVSSLRSRGADGGSSRSLSSVKDL